VVKEAGPSSEPTIDELVFSVPLIAAKTVATNGKLISAAKNSKPNPIKAGIDPFKKTGRALFEADIVLIVDCITHLCGFRRGNASVQNKRTKPAHKKSPVQTSLDLTGLQKAGDR
jgi:hypothetical protein